MPLEFNDLKLKRKEKDVYHDEIFWHQLGFRKIDLKLLGIEAKNDD